MGRVGDWLAAADIENSEDDSDLMRGTRRILVGMLVVVFGVLPVLIVANFIAG
jgi:hypothetical protein